MRFWLQELCVSELSFYPPLQYYLVKVAAACGSLVSSVYSEVLGPEITRPRGQIQGRIVRTSEKSGAKKRIVLALLRSASNIDCPLVSDNGNNCVLDIFSNIGVY